MLEFGPIDLVVLQGTSLCNLNCDYCYLSEQDRKSNKKLDLDLIEPIFEKLLTSKYMAHSEITVCWHAGEPLLLPIEYYCEAFSKIEKLRKQYKSNLEIVHSFQTNATLLTEEWCRFLRNNNALVGVSIDGPEFLHDKHRKNWAGLGSFEKAMKGVKLLQRYGIDFLVITVLTQDSLKHPEEMFQFYESNNIQLVGFNCEEIEGAHKFSSLANEANVVELYTNFMAVLWKLNQEADGPVTIREFANIVEKVMSEREIFDNAILTPFSIVSIDTKANFTTWSPELLTMDSEDYGNFILGNLLTDSLESVTSTDKFNNIYADIRQGVDACQQECSHFEFCVGGAPANKYTELGTLKGTETLDCRLRKKAILDVVLDSIERDLLVVNS